MLNDTSDIQYHDCVREKNAWFAVCLELVEGFSDKSEQEKNNIGKYGTNVLSIPLHGLFFVQAKYRSRLARVRARTIRKVNVFV